MFWSCDSHKIQCIGYNHWVIYYSCMETCFFASKFSIQLNFMAYKLFLTPLFSLLFFPHPFSQYMKWTGSILTLTAQVYKMWLYKDRPDLLINTLGPKCTNTCADYYPLGNIHIILMMLFVLDHMGTSLSGTALHQFRAHRQHSFLKITFFKGRL